MEKHEYKKSSTEGCVEWFVNEMLELETYMKHYFQNKIEKFTIRYMIVTNFEVDVGYVKQNPKRKKEEKPVNQDHCQLTGKFRSGAYRNFNLNTRRK